MTSLYDHFEMRLEVQGPVASGSPFDSGTLWGRILCALKSGSATQRDAADAWLEELREPPAGWLPPLILSEGFQCDASGEPWLPLPLAATLRLQSSADAETRKELKKISRAPMKMFAQICEGPEDRITAKDLLQLQGQRPSVIPALQPHLGMDRLSGHGGDGLLFMTRVSVYSVFSEPQSALAPQIIFLMKVRRQPPGLPDLIGQALKQICTQGWGAGKSQGLGRIGLKSFNPAAPPYDAQGATGFVSLSHFTPATSDPTEGQWKLHVKHPVPAQFIEGRRVALGEEIKWRVKSFLRLRAGSCLRFREENMREYYGRTLMETFTDAGGASLPILFHYALSYPWPIKLAGDGGKS